MPKKNDILMVLIRNIFTKIKKKEKKTQIKSFIWKKSSPLGQSQCEKLLLYITDELKKPLPEDILLSDCYFV